VLRLVWGGKIAIWGAILSRSPLLAERAKGLLQPLALQALHMKAIPFLLDEYLRALLVLFPSITVIDLQVFSASSNCFIFSLFFIFICLFCVFWLV
jgi:hypothetical protein